MWGAGVVEGGGFEGGGGEYCCRAGDEVYSRHTVDPDDVRHTVTGWLVNKQWHFPEVPPEPGPAGGRQGYALRRGVPNSSPPFPPLPLLPGSVSAQREGSSGQPG